MSNRFVNNIILNNNELVSARIENVSSFPTGYIGKIIFHLPTGVPYYHDGIEWKSFESAQDTNIANTNLTITDPRNLTLNNSLYIGNSNIGINFNTSFNNVTLSIGTNPLQINRGAFLYGLSFPSNNRSYSFPDDSGTLALVSDIPDLGDYVLSSRQITINGVTYNLTENRSWDIPDTNLFSDNLTATENRFHNLSTYALRFRGEEGVVSFGDYNQSTSEINPIDSFQAITNSGFWLQTGNTSGDYNYIRGVLGLGYLTIRSSDTINISTEGGPQINLSQQTAFISSPIQIDLASTQIRVRAVQGTGTRMVVTNAAGILSTQPIPDGGETENLFTDNLTLSNNRLHNLQNNTFEFTGGEDSRVSFGVSPSTYVGEFRVVSKGSNGITYLRSISSDNSQLSTIILNKNLAEISSSGFITLDATSGVLVSHLAGTGTRMVVADEDGFISTSSVPGGGSVTSVGIASTDLSVSNSPITTSGNITLNINNQAVTNAKIRNSAGLSVIGRSANSAGSVADITAATDEHVLRRSGSTLAFGTIGNNSISDVAWGKITGAPTFLTVANLANGTLNGEITNSAGTGVTLTNLITQGYPEANTHSGQGLQVYLNASGSTNYPTQFGGGIKYYRAEGSNLGHFEINKDNGGNELLRYRVGTGTSTYSDWKIFADRDWVASQIPGTPNLQQVTTVGNTTTNTISITNSGLPLFVNRGTVANLTNPIARFSQNGGSIDIINGTGQAGNFIPHILGINSGSNNTVGIILRGTGQDSYTLGGVVLQASNSDNTGAITSGTVLRVRNHGTSLLDIDYQGVTTINNLAGTGDRMVAANATGQLFTMPIPGGGGGGSVLSVGLSMPTAFSVANSPITTSGTINVTAAGTSSQYIRGDGSLATFPNVESVNNGTLTLNTSGIATGSQTFTANQATNATFTVNVPNTLSSYVNDPGFLTSVPSLQQVTNVGNTSTNPLFVVRISNGTLENPLAENAFLYGQNMSNYAAIRGLNSYSVSNRTGWSFTTGTGATQAELIRLWINSVIFPQLAGVGTRMAVIQANGTLSTQAIPTPNTYTGSTSINLNGSSFEREELTGDVTAPLNSNTTLISNNAVTFAKMQDISTQTLIGRYSAGSGDPQPITLGTGLTLSGAGVLSSSSGVANLALGTRTSTTVPITNSNGTGVTLPAATTSLAGVMTAVDKAKLDGIPDYTGSTSIILSGSSFQRAALTGDVTAPANSNATTISNNAVTTPKINNTAVTFAKIQNIPTQTLVGRFSAGNGAPESITLGTGLTLSGAGVLSSSGNNLFTANLTLAANRLHSLGSNEFRFRGANGVVSFGDFNTGTSTYQPILGFQATSSGTSIISSMNSAYTRHSSAEANQNNAVLRYKEGVPITTSEYVISAGFDFDKGVNCITLDSNSGSSRIFLEDFSTTVSSLSGTGTRMVVANSEGTLSTQPIPDYTLLKVFYVNGNNPNVGDGSVLDPFQTIDSAVIAVIGSGTRQAPQYVNAIIDVSSFSYSTNQNLFINTCSYRFSTGTTVNYTGTGFLIDSSVVASYTRFTISGRWNINSTLGKVLRHTVRTTTISNRISVEVDNIFRSGGSLADDPGLNPLFDLSGGYVGQWSSTKLELVIYGEVRSAYSNLFKLDGYVNLHLQGMAPSSRLLTGFGDGGRIASQRVLRFENGDNVFAPNMYSCEVIIQNIAIGSDGTSALTFSGYYGGIEITNCRFINLRQAQILQNSAIEIGLLRKAAYGTSPVSYRGLLIRNNFFEKDKFLTGGSNYIITAIGGAPPTGYDRDIELFGNLMPKPYRLHPSLGINSLIGPSVNTVSNLMIKEKPPVFATNADAIAAGLTQGDVYLHTAGALMLVI